MPIRAQSARVDLDSQLRLIPYRVGSSMPVAEAAPMLPKAVVIPTVLMDLGEASPSTERMVDFSRSRPGVVFGLGTTYDAQFHWRKPVRREC